MLGLSLIRTKKLRQLQQHNNGLQIRRDELEKVLRLKDQDAEKKQLVNKEQQRQASNKLIEAATAKHEATIKTRIGNYKRGDTVRIKADSITGVIRNIWWWEASDKPHAFLDEPHFKVRVPTKNGVSRTGKRQTRSIEDLSRYDIIELMSWEIEPIDETPSDKTEKGQS